MVTYINDCLLVGPSATKIKALKVQLGQAYDIEDLGPARYFLGVEIHCDRVRCLLWVNQKAYIEQAIQHFKLSYNGPVIPLSPGLIGHDSSSKPLNTTEIRLFQQLVGTTMYAMV